MTSRHKPSSHSSSDKEVAPLLIALIMGLFVLGLALFLTIYSAIIKSGYVTGLDQSVMQWMITHRTPFLTTIMEFVTTILSPVGFAIIVIASSGFWIWRKKELWRPLLLLGAMTTAFIVTAVIKALVERARPPIEHMVPPFELDFAFPSGHAIGIAVFVFVLGYLIYSRRRTLTVLVAWISIGIFSIAIVAFSRLYLGYHWVTDVSASVSLALIILAAVITIDSLQPKQRVTTTASNSDR